MAATQPPDGLQSRGSPDGPSAPPPDLVGVALGSIVVGAAGGACTVAIGLVLLRSALDSVLPLLLFAGIAVGAGAAWLHARTIADWWRRGVTSALAVFAAMMLTALTAPADMVAGRTGVLVFAGLALVAAVAASRYVRRSETRGW